MRLSQELRGKIDKELGARQMAGRKTTYGRLMDEVWAVYEKRLAGAAPLAVEVPDSQHIAALPDLLAGLSDEQVRTVEDLVEGMRRRAKEGEKGKRESRRG